MPIMFGTQPPAGQPAITGTTTGADLAARYGGAAPAIGPSVAPTEPVLWGGYGYNEFDENKITDANIANARYDKADIPISRAIRKFDNMSFAQQRRTLRLLAIGGFAGAISLKDIDEAISEASQQDAREAYRTLLEAASDYYMNTGARVSPEDVLRSAIAYRLQGEGISWNGKFSAFKDGISKDMLREARIGSGGVGAGHEPDSMTFGGQVITKPGTYSETQTSTDILNPQDAKALTRAMLQNELGRDPTQAEYEDFLSAINAAERENPATQKTTIDVVRDHGQLLVDDQRTVTHQGIGAEGLGQVAYEKAQRQPGWAEWQAMGTYAPALYAALGAAVPGV